MLHVVYVVPCYNEAARLDLAAFETLLELGPVHLLFVDDGSTDATAELLGRFVSAHEGRAALHRMPKNSGKGEAVRTGLRRAIADGAPFVGYADADLATPPAELARLASFAVASTHEVVMGSRIARAGARIERRPARHYLGRFFATYASLLLDARVYDTQCGAKVLRASTRLSRALEVPFVSRWVFDIELLARLMNDRDNPMPFSHVIEIPLDRWEDVGGSKIRAAAVPRIAGDILRASVEIGSLRRAGRRPR